MWEGESLLYVLRERLGLPGSKNACEQGECGSCSVYLDGVLVCACLVLAAQAEGREIVTVEGLAADGELHPVQEAFLDAGAVQCGFCTPGLIVATHDLLAPHRRIRATPRSARRWPATCAAAPGTRRSSTRCGSRPAHGSGMSERIVIEGCAIATVDDEGRGVRRAGTSSRGRSDRRGGRGPRTRGARPTGASTAAGCSRRPGLINCHHHLYQWATRGLAQAGDAVRVAGRSCTRSGRSIDERGGARGRARGSRRACAARAARPSTDHHYLFPRDAGDLLPVEIEAAHASSACASTRAAARWTSGASAGRAAAGRGRRGPRRDPRGLRGGDRPLPRPSPGAMVRIALAPCSPFSVTRELMRESAELARARGVRLHTHMAETVDEERVLPSSGSAAGRSSTSSELGWLGEDVWLAHCIHLDEHEVARFGATGTGVAHCPSSNARLGAGIAPVVDLLRRGRAGRARGRRRGLQRGGRAGRRAAPGAAGRAAARRARGAERPRGARAGDDPRRALPRARGRDRDARGRASCADVALWRVDGVGHAGIDDPVAALVFGAAAPRSTRCWSTATRRRRGRRAAHGPTQAIARDARRARGRRGWRSRAVSTGSRRSSDRHRRPRRRRGSVLRPDGTPKVRASSPTRPTCGPRACCGARRCARPHPRARIRSIDISPALARARRACGPDARGRARGARPTASSTPTSPCSRGTRSATRARPWRSWPPTTPRPRGAPPPAIEVEYEVLAP